MGCYYFVAKRINDWFAHLAVLDAAMNYIQYTGIL